MSVIDDFLKKVEPSQRAELERVRKIIKVTVPDAQETISYGLPTFKYNGKPLIYFGAFKGHMSIFPTSKPTLVLADKLKDYKVSKGTVQFTVDKPLSESLIKQILQIRLADISEN